jgi:hypothetical protein
VRPRFLLSASMLAVACGATPAREPTPLAGANYLPCDGKSCGEPCSLCPPGEADCREAVGSKACDPTGQCRMLPFACEPPSAAPAQDSPEAYVACSGKRCGEPCSICPPGAPDCVETAEPKVCNQDGRCVPAPATCTGKPGESAESHQ